MKMIFARTAGALCALAFAGSAMAQPAPPSTDPSAVQPGAYKVEPHHTRVAFSIMHFGFTHYYGDFSGVTGTLNLDPHNVAASQVDISIPTNSVMTTNTTLDGELVSPQFFDAAANPTIHFVSRSITRTGPNKATIVGDLTLHGVTKPVTLDAKFNASGPNPLNHHYTVGFDAVGHLNRSDFGVNAYVPMVSDNVDIMISAAFEKAN
jgi:polyisoprenoid-binding protein YceI